MSGRRTRFNAYDDDPMRAWYNALNGTEKERQEYIADKHGSFFNYERDTPFKYSDEPAYDWFYSAIRKREIRNNTFNMESFVGHQKSKKIQKSNMKLKTRDFAVPVVEPERAIVDKKRPQNPPVPYFEYLFADAGLKTCRKPTTKDSRKAGVGEIPVFNDQLLPDFTSTYHEEEVSSLVGGDLITPPTTPGTHFNDVVDDYAIHQHAFHHAGIPLTSQELADNYRAAAGTGLAGTGNFVLDEAEEAEKAEASAGFYGGFAVEESPSAYHAPNIDEASGFGDVRDGAEAFPEQWTNNEARPQSYTIAQADAMVVDYGNDFEAPQPKEVLHPKSQKARFGKNKHRMVENKESTNSGCPSSFSVASTSSTPTVKKRAARDSFDTEATQDTDNNQVQYLCTKKIRTSLNDKHEVHVKSLCAPIYSLISDVAESDLEEQIDPPTTVINIFSQASIKGFPGQFRGKDEEEKVVEVDMSVASSMHEKNRFIMGDVLHPNYLFTHTNFNACSDPDKINYTTKACRYDSGVRTNLEYADQMNIVAALLERTKSQEHLRREVHLECASARLEGVAVGTYRYYQGHLNVEEYKDAGICVCWEKCACSKMCTRYGDLMCPCSEDIEMHED